MNTIYHPKKFETPSLVKITAFELVPGGNLLHGEKLSNHGKSI